MWPADRQSDRQAGVPEHLQLAEHFAVLEHAALEGRRVDLVEAEPVAQKRTALGQLVAEMRERVVLYLIHVGADLPVGDIAVTPFGPHRHMPERKRAPVEP